MKQQSVAQDHFGHHLQQMNFLWMLSIIAHIPVVYVLARWFAQMAAGDVACLVAAGPIATYLFAPMWIGGMGGELCGGKHVGGAGCVLEWYDRISFSYFHRACC